MAATQQGVFSFLTKPVDRDALYKAIDEAMALSAPAGDESWREAIVTRSPLMLRLLEQARMVAQSDVSVLIHGQSGTGKEVLAQAIHAASPRAKKAFIAINCGALPEPLLESELFGHAKGALPARSAAGRGCFRRRKAVRCFWMKSAICRCRCRSSYCGCCRSARCVRWAAIAIWISMCGSFPPPIVIYPRRWKRRVPRRSLLSLKRGEYEAARIA